MHDLTDSGHDITVKACVGRESPSSPSAAELYLAKLSPGSRPAAASACRIIAAILGTTDPRRINFELLSPGLVAGVCATLQEKGRPGYARRLQGALAGLIRAAWRGCCIEAEHRDRLLESIPKVVVSQPPTGTGLSRFQVEALLQVATVRQRAMIALGVGAGLRRHEMAALRATDITAGFGKVLVEVNQGKGGKYRKVEVAGRLAVAIRNQLDWCKHVRIPDVMFLGYTVDGISKSLASLSEATGVSFTPHDLRRTFCTDALARGVPLHVVQQLMGHSDPRTTVKYDRGFDDERSKAAEKLAF
jgi:integrase